MTTLVATDLDRTLIYSANACGDTAAAVVAVERYRDADASWMTARAAAGLAALAARCVLVPATTRTPEQYARVRLPGPPPRFAICANGGVLLVDGQPDEVWAKGVADACAAVAPLTRVLAHARAVLRPEWVSALREAAGLFCYAVLDRAAVPDDVLAATSAWADRHGWAVSLQGRKLYWVPRPLTKSAAVSEVSARVGADRVLAAGDSLLDADLLSVADHGVLAAHGELAASGWRADHVEVTTSRGVLAGEQVVERLAALVALVR